VTNRDVALLAFKLLGACFITLAVVGAANLPILWAPLFARDTPPSVPGTAFTLAAPLFPLLLTFGIGYALWFSASWLAERTFPVASAEPLRLDGTWAEPLLTVALSIIGVVLVADALPTVVNVIVLHSHRDDAASVWRLDGRAEAIWGPGAQATAAGAAARLLAGAVLIGNRTRLSRLLTRAEAPAADQPTEDDATGS
jgi:hypothetical protein